jgi:hypothetical protein
MLKKIDLWAYPIACPVFIKISFFSLKYLQQETDHLHAPGAKINMVSLVIVLYTCFLCKMYEANAFGADHFHFVLMHFERYWISMKMTVGYLYCKFWSTLTNLL